MIKKKVLSDKQKIKILREALTDISAYILPTYTFDTGKYVPLNFVSHLLITAREALDYKVD